MTPTWTYDEFKHIGVDFADPEQVQRYDERQHTDVAEEAALVRALDIQPGQVVVEFGCGTGAFSMAAALAGARVIAVDISQAMLNYTKQRAANAGVEIETVNAGFLTYTHQGSPADLVLTKYAFHHLPDFWKLVALHRIHTLLKPGGAFYLEDVVFSFDEANRESEIERWISDITKDDGSFSRQDFEMHVRDEFSTYGWILEEMLQRVGFTLAAADYRSPTYAAYRAIAS